MNKNLFVSVIVPNYNYAKFLDERIQSILSQTYQNFEIIILDDCSSDNGASKIIIEKYRTNPRVSHIVYNETNSGSPFKQWNKGFELAKGELIWIAESDDFCSPVFLETLVPLYLKNEAVLTFCHSELVDENGHKLRENHQMNSVSSDISMNGKEFIKKYLAYSNEVQNASCAIFSKKAALDIDKQYMNYKGAGDWLFWINLAEKGNVCYASATCNNYRLHSNTTSKVVKSGLEFHEMKSIYEWLLKKNYLDDKRFQKCKLNNLFLISSIDEIPHNVKKELYHMWGADFIQLLMVRARSIISIFARFLYA